MIGDIRLIVVELGITKIRYVLVYVLRLRLEYEKIF
jgi:hypothetical protein